MNYVRSINSVVNITHYSRFEKRQTTVFNAEPTDSVIKERPSGKFNIVGVLVNPKIDGNVSVSYGMGYDVKYVRNETLASDLTTEEADAFLDKILNTGNDIIECCY